MSYNYREFPSFVNANEMKISETDPKLYEIRRYITNQLLVVFNSSIFAQTVSLLISTYKD